MLTHALDVYLATRRATGFELKTPEYLLRSFARFAAERTETHVRAQTAVEWASQAPSLSQRDRRLKNVIRFARHARAEDPAHEIPPEHVFPHSQHRRLPYIFSQDEIRRLLEQAGRLGPAGSLRPHTHQTLFGLLASCGLRISEALALQIDDVTADGLQIRHTKFRKSRLVPMHATTAGVLNEYLRRRRRVGGSSEQVFVNLHGRPLRYGPTNATFLRLVRELGLHPGPGKPGPRIHDLRHTFAVRAFEACPQGRRAIAKHMLALSTYLGHAHVSDTYWYLHSTPRLMADIADACEAYVESVQP